MDIVEDVNDGAAGDLARMYHAWSSGWLTKCPRPRFQWTGLWNREGSGELAGCLLLSVRQARL